MPRNVSFVPAAQVGRVQLDADNRLTRLSAARKKELTGALNAMDAQAQQQIMLSFVNQNIKHLDDTVPLMTRIGVYVVMFSQIESRIRAMYRQRHAVIYDLPAPQPSNEDDDDAQISPYVETDDVRRVETTDLNRVAAVLRKYDDIDKDTSKEITEFINIRNKMIHQALYRFDAFKTDIMPALLELYHHVVRVRARLNTRLKRERTLYPAKDRVQATVRQRLSDIPTNASVTRLDIFTRLGGSPDLSMPIIARNPLFLVIQSEVNAGLQVILKNEAEYNDLCDEVVHSQQPYVVFQKQIGGHQQTVKRLGEGIIESAERDTNGRYKFLNIRLV